MIRKLILNFYYTRLRSKFRISSEPYLTGDTLRKYSDHILDENSEFEISSVIDNDLVFVKTDYLKIFFEHYYSKIDKKIKLITHNSDLEISKESIKNFNFEKDYWFAQNVNFCSDLVVQIPIGLENRNYLNNGLLNHFKNLSIDKVIDNKIISSFNEDTNLDRKYIKKLIHKNSKFDLLEPLTHKEYIKRLSKYKFSLCPSGNGLDTHRFWESIITKTLPIVLNSDFIMNFAKQGVPMYVVDNWIKKIRNC